MSWFSPQQAILSQFESRQASMIDQLEPDRSTIALNHFVEWFSGDALDSIWDQNSVGAPAVFSMVDAIDEGFSISVSATFPESGGITAGNDERAFDEQNAIIDTWVRRVTVGTGGFQTGFGNRADGDLGNTPDFAMVMQDSISFSFVNISLIDNVTTTTVSSSVAVNNNWQYFRGELFPSRLTMHINGILEATVGQGITNLVGGVYAGFRMFNTTTLSAESRIKYMEVYHR